MTRRGEGQYRTRGGKVQIAMSKKTCQELQGVKYTTETWDDFFQRVARGMRE